MLDGVTDMVVVVTPAFHEYVDAPLAVNKVDEPLQILGEFTLTVGVAFTVNVLVIMALLPAEFDATNVTENVPAAV